MKDFLKENWFKVSIVVLVGLLVLSFSYYFVIFLPDQKRSIALNEELKLIQEQTQKQEKEDNLKECLEESDYQVTSSHLWQCGSLGRSDKMCADVFGGSKSDLQSFYNYKEIFPESDSDKFLGFFEDCNCGLEKTRRDEFTKEKESRDSICFNLYK